ncbi:unnamed protein product [Anisakis simplex]|uniref:Uncharacterized protein n=1 Tax=Anisakis simplex TaxID=6269 RepID=A0A0M3JWS6_ANISI|nr:unnamed protein product [Anisakis simplex]
MKEVIRGAKDARTSAAAAAAAALNAKLLCNDSAATIASRATGLLMTVCFFLLPLLWSHMINRNQPSINVCYQHNAYYDPWSDLTELQ